VGLLRAIFVSGKTGPAFIAIEADYWVDVTDRQISSAIFRYLVNQRGP
jgi:hypothetical protein